MIRYALACRQGHAFESWFRNSDAFDEQAKRGLILCPDCGSSEVEKALMAPSLSRALKDAPSPAPPAGKARRSHEPASTTFSGESQGPAPVAIMSPQERELRARLQDLHAFLTRTAEHVGSRFPEEARKMHYGESDPRSIYGEASPDEARALIEEGIEFHPLPPLPDEHN